MIVNIMHKFNSTIFNISGKLLEAQCAEPVSLTCHSALRKLNTEPSIGASHQVSVHFAKQFQSRFFINQPTRNKNCLRQPCLLTDRDEISNLFRGPSIEATKFRFNWLSSFKEEDF